ncbi:phage holin family protein [Magnetospirillum aberrantis]|uniref:Phage holin family protein n=1 Tax=Magnetospirillum aberrantis SpK TaxID=908842 RepID=A0A7C9QT84_9PROT|nr:phage holin family protein [Magnetospirillum aberrantis]NFV79985.1 hypothetical protein [Magnetospirillum aberrantis SpK]
MPERSIASEWGAITATVLALLPAPLLARLLYHRRLVRLGKRRMWSWELAWEPPTAALCAILAGGLGEWLSLPPLATHALAGVVGWLGPRGLEVVATRYFGAEPTGLPRNGGEEG